MGVAVDDRLDIVEAVDRVGEARAAEEGIDFERLALDRLGDRRIMEHGDGPLGAQRAQRVLEDARLVERLVDEGLDRRLAERAELAAAEAADEALDAGEADALDHHRLLAEHGHAGLLAGCAATSSGWPHSIIVVAEHGDDRDRAGAQVLGEDLGLARPCRNW